MTTQEISRLFLRAARNCNEMALTLTGTGFNFDIESKARREDMRSLIEIAEEDLASAKKAMAEMGLKYSE